jgi:type VI secretion system secreted protein VgrG
MSTLVTTFIKIGSTTLTQFSECTLQQSIFAHHTFKIVCPGNLFADVDPFAKPKGLIGERCIITIDNFETNNKQLTFMGLVTEVQAHKFNTYVGDIVIHGYSPTVLLDGLPHCKTWEQQTLKNIVQDVTKEFPQNEIVLKATPKHKSPLPYIVQYKETAWQFISRMGAQLGEWLFYNGKELVFGVFNNTSTELTFGSNLTHFSLAMQVRPNSFTQKSYV